MRLLIGPTSAGKSTLAERWQKESAEGGSATTIHMAYEIGGPSEIPNGPHDVVHFNLLRRFKHNRQKTGPVGVEMVELLPEMIEAAEHVVVLSAPREVLLERSAGRELTEPNQEGHDQRKYHKERWEKALSTPLLAQLYEQLALYLEQAGKTYEFLCSNGAVHDDHMTVSRWEFPRLAGPDAAGLCEAGHPEPKIDITESTYQVDYRKDASAGSSRSATFARALQMPLGGKRLLDIGCAEGAAAMCAHRMGAKVTGIEPRPRRFKQATAIAKSLGYKIDFRNVLLDGLDAAPGSFDVVLAFNVIHHVPDPFAFLDQATALTTSHLVLEYPGMADRRFRSTFERQDELSDELPLIGVSTSEVDQSFVYTPAALERYLIGATGAFTSHTVLPSPKPNRWISVFSGRGDLAKPEASKGAGAESSDRSTNVHLPCRQEVERLEAQIDRMRRSRSWRLTAPLRAVNRRLGK